MKDNKERECSTLMQQALEVSVMLDKFPKSTVDIYALVLESDGGFSFLCISEKIGELSAAITCASMALADAGIECFDLVSSCSVVNSNKERNILTRKGMLSKNVILDPTFEEEKQQSGSVTIAFMPSLNEVTQLYQSGEIDLEKTQEVRIIANLLTTLGNRLMY